MISHLAFVKHSGAFAALADGMAPFSRREVQRRAAVCPEAQSEYSVAQRGYLEAHRSIHEALNCPAYTCRALYGNVVTYHHSITQQRQATLVPE
jgi:hypothetical protein